MSINKTYAVFGLGRYGLSVAKELVNNGAEVIAVDSNEKLSNDIINDLINEESRVVIFKEYKSVNDSLQAVKSGDVNSAWILKSNLKSKVSSFLKGEDIAPVKETFEGIMADNITKLMNDINLHIQKVQEPLNTLKTDKSAHSAH